MFPYKTEEEALHDLEIFSSMYAYTNRPLFIAKDGFFYVISSTCSEENAPLFVGLNGVIYKRET